MSGTISDSGESASRWSRRARTAGISSALADSPLKPVVGVTDYDMDEEREVITEMLSWRPSGLIVALRSISIAASNWSASRRNPLGTRSASCLEWLSIFSERL